MRGPRLGQAKCLLQGHLSVLSYGLQGVSVFIRAPTIVLSAGLGTRRSYAALFLDLRSNKLQHIDWGHYLRRILACAAVC